MNCIESESRWLNVKFDPCDTSLTSGKENQVLHLPGLETVSEADKSRHAYKESSEVGTYRPAQIKEWYHCV